ncbi:hypothetical protein [Pectobacterium zantedeschiae]|nr:hypothetical protein [Pectobacterium zantedeschiae]
MWYLSLTRYNVMTYDYDLLNPLSEEPTVITALEQAGTELKKQLFDIATA